MNFSLEQSYYYYSPKEISLFRMTKILHFKLGVTNLTNGISVFKIFNRVEGEVQ